MIEREYEYRLKAGRVEARAALWAVAAVGFTCMALTNDRGLFLFVLPLERGGATVAYWVFAGLAALFAIVDGVHVARRGELRQRIAFTAEGLLVPRSIWSEEEKLIPYGAIRDVKLFSEPDSIAIIRHRDGDYELRMDLLPSERDYAEVVQWLGLRVQAAKLRAAVPGASPTASA